MNMDTYHTGCSVLCSHSFGACRTQMSACPICTGLCFLKSHGAHSLYSTLSPSQCETLDEYSTLSLHREIRIQDMYKPHTNICQSVSSMNLHPNVLKFPSPLSGNAYFLIIHREAVKHPGLVNFLFLLSFKQWIL